MLWLEQIAVQSDILNRNCLFWLTWKTIFLIAYFVCVWVFCFHSGPLHDLPCNIHPVDSLLVRSMWFIGSKAPKITAKRWTGKPITALQYLRPFLFQIPAAVWAVCLWHSVLSYGLYFLLDFYFLLIWSSFTFSGFLSFAVLLFLFLVLFMFHSSIQFILPPLCSPCLLVKYLSLF